MPRPSLGSISLRPWRSRISRGTWLGLWGAGLVLAPRVPAASICPEGPGVPPALAAETFSPRSLSAETLARVQLLDKEKSLLLIFTNSKGPKALFKPDLTTRGHGTPSLTPRQSEVTFYAFAQRFQDVLKFEVPQTRVVEVASGLLLTKSQDDPKTQRNEAELLQGVLAGAHPEFPRPKLRSTPLETLWKGSLTDWVSGSWEHPELLRPNRKRLEQLVSSIEDAPPSLGKKLAQLFVTDYLLANNDRAGNMRFGSNDRVFAIDNDSCLLYPDKKVFCRKLAFGLSRVPRAYLCALEASFLARTPEEIQDELFFAYPKASRLGFAKEFLGRLEELSRALKDRPSFDS